MGDAGRDILHSCMASAACDLIVPTPICTSIIDDVLVNQDREDKIGAVQYMSKPRTALFKGGEDDKPMAPHDIHTLKSSIISNVVIGDYLELFGLKFGAINFDEKYSKNMDKITRADLSSNIIFSGVNCHKKREEKKERKYIFIGAMQVYVDDELPI